MTRCSARLGLLVALGGTCVWGCTDDTRAVTFGEAAEGERCGRVSDCQAGLDCVDDVCTPFEADGSAAGSACSSDTDCGEGLICGRQGLDGAPAEESETRLCTDLPLLADGDRCGFTVQCDFGLACSGKGRCTAEGDPRTLDLGEECTAFDDCRRPYICSPLGTCERLPLYLGPNCERSAREAGAFRGYFEVPPAERTEDIEFYRLPYPNDIRVREGLLDLSGHPSPGELLGASVDELYYAPLERDSEGFAVNQPVFLRFSDRVDPATLCLDAGGVYPEVEEGDRAFCPTAGEASVFLVNVTASSPDYGARRAVELVYNENDATFICRNALGVAPLPGEPLNNGETYAVVVTTAITDLRGDAPIQDRDFAALLADAVPDAASRPELGAAHEAMAPLRAWLAAEGIDPGTLATAAVFTTEDATRFGAGLRSATRTLVAQIGDDAVLCPGTAPSPCAIPDAADRGCPASAPTDWFEIQGTYEGPVFQEGTRPYLASGGAIALDGDGDPILQSATETMCFGLAVPRTGAMPLMAGTYPVVIYGHGTGGNYRSAFEDGTVELLTSAGFAVLTFDNVMHGPRQGTEIAAAWQDPGQLFFNPLNPRGSRDNVLQGAADLFRLAHLAESATFSVGGVDISFDPDQIYYYGHSQGTVISPAFLAYETNLAGVFQSGAGAELALSILNKSEPQVVDQAVAASFGERSLERVHPMLGLLAQLFGRADAPAYATRIVQERPAGGAFPYLQVLGTDDNYSPDVTQYALVRALGIPLVGPVEQSLPGIAEVASPQLGATVAGAVQLAPDGYDGHFVAFRNPTARAVILDFFTQALAGNPRIQNP